MHRNEALYQFLKNHAKEMTEEWYQNIDKNSTKGVYSSQNPTIIENLMKQNYEFHIHFIEAFLKEEKEFFQEFDSWIKQIASDSEHIHTPIHFVIKEFKNVRNQYLKYIKRFAEEHQEVTQNELDRWNAFILKGFDDVVLRFIEATYEHSQSVLHAQQEMIQELSSPVISLDQKKGLLPLIGDIDTSRAKLIMENTLKQCAERGIHHLFIDLSGVVMIDTMVAHQLFKLLDALRLIGVQTTLSGIRPEIAQTAVHLGLSFEDTVVKANLAKALGNNN